MAIPKITPYPMPKASELPANKVNWTPDPKRAALLIHDMQNYFLAAFTPDASPLNELIVHIQALKQRCDELGIPVIYSAQPGAQTLEQRGLLQDFWGNGIPGGEEPKAIVQALEPSEKNILLTKWRYSAFQKTNLHDLLIEQGRDQLMVCGVYAHIGCLLSASEAFMKDIEPFFIADALADFSEDYHLMALKYAAERCAVVTTTSQVLEALGNAAVQAGAVASEAGAFSEPEIRRQVAELLGVESKVIADEDNLMDLGLDSVRMMSLVEKWRREGAEVTFVELAEEPTLSRWWKLLSGQAQLVLPNADYLR
ncbi:isochorismatase family protein [Paenibacillus turpanensis]|uniref:isochorismatase family protein n=1 Tax=Paenibacillus turpanensis TaxID=2689078 RepID=UPI00140BF565|nr:isochorismatase family protein [Paenibacillus turpanensis]